MRRPVMVGVLVAAIIALVGSAAVAFGARDGASSWQSPGRGFSMMGGQGQGFSMMGGQGQGFSMMGGQGQGSSMMGGQGQGSSMMGGQGQGFSMMGGQGQGSSMMGAGMVWPSGKGAAVASIPAARARATTAAAASGLHPGEVIQFDNGFYVELKDSSNKPATEVLIDPRTGSVTTEPGPAMMWNTRFGMMRAGAGGTGSVDSAKARSIATSWLAANRAGTTIRAIDTYPGYFTVDLQTNGAVSGMMSVSSVTGAVWYHTWHGTFIAMKD